MRRLKKTTKNKKQKKTNNKRDVEITTLFRCAVRITSMTM